MQITLLKDLEDRDSSCFLERIILDERGTDFTKPKNDVWRHIVQASSRPVLTGSSSCLVHQVRGSICWSQETLQASLVCVPGSAKQKSRMTQYLHSACVFLPSVPPEH